jgi:hypothetical protein
VRGSNALEVKRMKRAFDSQAIILQGLQVRPACNKRDLLPGSLKSPAYVGAHTARTHDRNAHPGLLCQFEKESDFSPCRPRASANSNGRWLSACQSSPFLCP